MKQEAEFGQSPNFQLLDLPRDMHKLLFLTSLSTFFLLSQTNRYFAALSRELTSIAERTFSRTITTIIKDDTELCTELNTPYCRLPYLTPLSPRSFGSLIYCPPFLLQYTIISNNQKKHGLAKVSKDNRLLFQATFKNNKLNGEHYVWYQDGRICAHSFYNDNKLHGRDIIYFPNGRVYHEQIHPNGRKIWTSVDEYFPTLKKFTESQAVAMLEEHKLSE